MAVKYKKKSFRNYIIDFDSQKKNHNIFYTNYEMQHNSFLAASLSLSCTYKDLSPKLHFKILFLVWCVSLHYCPKVHCNLILAYILLQIIQALIYIKKFFIILYSYTKENKPSLLYIIVWISHWNKWIIDNVVIRFALLLIC